jgi:hypothetical protein
MMVNRFNRPKPDDHMVDIGRGPAEILAFLSLARSIAGEKRNERTCNVFVFAHT